jgi:hypothetical protein
VLALWRQSAALASARPDLPFLVPTGREQDRFMSAAATDVYETGVSMIKPAC